MVLWFAAGVLYLAGVGFAQGWVLTASQPHAVACIAGGLLCSLLSGGASVVAKLRPPAGS